MLEQFELEDQARRIQAEVGARDFKDRCTADIGTDELVRCSDALAIDFGGGHEGSSSAEGRPLARRPYSRVKAGKGSPFAFPVLLYLGSWLIVYMKAELALRALANDRRLQILGWLKQPRKHFRPQVDGDLVEDGVCGVLIAEKLGVSQPTASEHMKILLRAGLVRAKRIKQWTFYQRDESKIKKAKQTIFARF
jgi:ArsR family transcriptional regulator